jgi:putative DNA primase/helicase
MNRPPQHVETGALLARLAGVRSSGSGWVALCPSHSDHLPSLAVAEGRKGVVLTCHAGCPTASVISEVGLKFRNLFYR